MIGVLSSSPGTPLRPACPLRTHPPEANRGTFDMLAQRGPHQSPHRLWRSGPASLAPSSLWWYECATTLHNVSTVVLGRGVPGCVDRERGQLGEIGSRWHVLAVHSCTPRFLWSSSNAGKRASSRSIRRINKATAFPISSVYSVDTEEDS